MASGGGRISALDGLRALAIALVLADHSFFGFEGGGIGVSVFFVLSGFLITTLLVRERQRTGAVSLKLFYSRRGLRLVPALLVMLVVTVALGCSAKMGLIAGTYTTDLYNAITGNSVGPYQHTWSLSLEEQFYLVWPFLLLPLGLRYRRHAVTIVMFVAFASTLAAYLVTRHLVATDGEITSAVFNPLLQMHGLLVGCALALAPRPKLSARQANGLVLGGTAAILIIAVLASKTVEHDWAAWWNLLAELASAAVIAGMAAGVRLGAIARLYESAPAIWIGARSYGIYLWHVPLIYLVALHGLAPAEVGSINGAAIIGVPLAFAAAAISYRWIETPFLRLKDRLHRTAPVIATSHPAPVAPATS